MQIWSLDDLLNLQVINLVEIDSFSSEFFMVSFMYLKIIRYPGGVAYQWSSRPSTEQKFPGSNPAKVYVLLRIYALQCCYHNLICFVIVCTREKKMIKIILLR
jgi:hypothetical protein